MADVRITPVILCGGSGTRLWPRSRASKAKPFLPLVTQETLFEQALLRCSDRDRFDPPIVVTGARHVQHVEAQLWAAPDAQTIVEPEPKNTAAAIALAALRLNPDAVMLVCPSDHYIGDRESFVDAAASAAELAAEGWLVCFGIEPSAPETGFGYVRRGEPLAHGGFKVAEYVEKPDLDRAVEYVASGEYSWNGGIFAFSVREFLAELGEHRPALLASTREAVEKGGFDDRTFLPDPVSFSAIEGESIDYAVMEKTRRAAILLVRMSWSDIGNWRALHAARDRNSKGNTVRGPAELVECTNLLVETDGPRVHAIGLEDIIIVVDGNDVLVTSTAGAQLVGKLSSAINQ